MIVDMAVFLSGPCTGRVHLRLAIMILISLLGPDLIIGHSGEDPLQYNIWTEHRQAIKKPADPTTLYARERHCKAPSPVEAVKAHTHKESTWSVMFSRYTMDGGMELSSWLKNQENHPDTKGDKIEDLLSDAYIPIAFPFFFAIFLAASVFVIPVLGAVGFHLFELIWWVATHPEIKRFGRRLIIMCVRTSRKRERSLLADTIKNPPKTRFRMPKFFRIRADEELPDELEEPDAEGDWLDRAVQSDEDQDENDELSDGGFSLSGLDSDMEIDALFGNKSPPDPHHSFNSIGIQVSAFLDSRDPY